MKLTEEVTRQGVEMIAISLHREDEYLEKLADDDYTLTNWTALTAKERRAYRKDAIKVLSEEVT